MTATDLLALNLEEVRRRSLKVWHAIPPDRLHWKMDAGAMSCIETVRHVLEGEFVYMSMLKTGRSPASEETPFTGRPYQNVEAEVTFAVPFRSAFLQLVRSYSSERLLTETVNRSDKGYVRTAGDFILRVAYHESIHAGQLLANLRTMGAARPNIWD